MMAFAFLIFFIIFVKRRAIRKSPASRRLQQQQHNLRGGQIATSAVIGQTFGWKDNLNVVEEKHQSLIKALVDKGQSHLFTGWAEPGVDDEKKRQMMQQLDDLDKAYPGGLLEYVSRSRDLLKEAMSGSNPLSGFVPSIPTGERLEAGSPRFMEMEAIGLSEAQNAAFVLVAGGLGERLGFSGIKISLPNELVTGKPYIQL
eukprot:jgi/Bigna1/137795/aug1.41_g12503